MSLYVIYDLSSIKKRFLFKARLPDLIQDFEAYSTQLSTALISQQVDLQQIKEILAKCHALLENLSEKLENKQRKHVISLMDEINPPRQWFGKHQDSSFTEEKAWKIYTSMLRTLTAIKNFEKDISWG